MPRNNAWIQKQYLPGDIITDQNMYEFNKIKC